MAQITSAYYQFYPQLFDTISGPAKDLITKLLKDSLEERISAEEIMKHPWLQDSQVIRRSKRLVEEVDVEVIHEEVMDYPFNLFEFKF
jgi:serine/threonine protein kinase